MNTDLFQHFGHVQDNSDMYWHGFGLKPTAKYKQKWWLRHHQNLKLYDKNGTSLNAITGLARNTFNSYAVCSPSANRLVTVASDTSSVATINIVEVSTANLIASIVEPSGNVDIDIDTNGDIYAFNKSTRVLKKYDKNGVLIQTFNALAGTSNNAGGVYLNKKRKVIWVTSGSNASNGVYDLTLTNKLIDGIGVETSTAGIARGGFLTKDRLLSFLDYLATIRKYDFSTNTPTLVETNTIDIRPTNQNIYTFKYHGEVKGRIYYSAKSSTNSCHIVYIDKNYVKQLVDVGANSDVLAIDDKFAYVKQGTNLKIYSTTDFSLLSTSTFNEDFDSGGSTRGREVNFSDYVY